MNPTEPIKNDPTAPRLLLAEFADELDAFLAHCRQTGENPASATVLALQPPVRIACRERGLACRDTLEFFGNDAHVAALRESHRLTSLVAGEYVLPSGLPLRRTLRNTFLYYVRFYLNNYLRLLEILRAVQRRHPQATLLAVAGGPPSARPPEAEPFLTGSDRFTARLVLSFCRRHGLDFVEIAPRSAVRPLSARRPAAAAGGFLRNLARSAWQRRLQRLGRQPVVLLTAPSYHLDRLGAEIGARFAGVRCAVVEAAGRSGAGYLRRLLAERMRREGARLTAVPVDLFDGGDDGEEKRTAQAVRDAWAGFIGRRSADFVYTGCSLAEELTGKVVTDLAGHLGWLGRQAAVQLEVLKWLQPKLIVAPVAIGSFQAWAELGRRLNLTTLVVPQKGLVAPPDEVAGLEEHYIGRAQVSHDFSHAAAQSPLVADYFRWAGFGGKVLKTGNLIFARRPSEVSRPAGRPPVIVFAPSMKSRKSCRFHVLETLDELLASLGDVFAAIGQLPDCRLVVRIHPGEPIRRADIESLLPMPANASISDSGPFEQVLAEADLLISFSSTSIQEALLNGVPVVLFDRWKRYNHLHAPRAGETAASAAALYLDDPRQLAPTLRGIIDRRPLAGELFRPYRYGPDQAETLFSFVRACIEKRESHEPRPDQG